uniref:Ribonuclease Z n=1 Tax=Spyridia filamentosa TaxID=196632 RepID=A0A1Z1MJ86_SPYFI|nr:ribonuclease Z [Spyridia filamentosa]ARW66118.1 ribonuclease Z [Spyridia filamentosa]
MEISELSCNFSDFNYLKKKSFILKIIHSKDIWLFNCFEGCQYNLIFSGVKINQITTVIIADLNICNISGLPGLLSTLNLMNRNKILSIYGPKSLIQYLDLQKKYSRTNFGFTVYFYDLSAFFAINFPNYYMYSFSKHHSFEFIILESEKYSKFLINQALKFNLLPSPLYAQLKRGLIFIMPDGFILYGSYFTQFSYDGHRFFYTSNKYHDRQLFEYI